MKKFFRNISLSMVKLFSGGKPDRLLNMALETKEKKEPVFITYKERPKTTEKIPQVHTKKDFSSCAIVVQGPILAEDNFTLESIRLYIKHFPGVHIVLSTWTDENIRPFVSLGITIVQSEKPAVFGPQNINLQLTSTYSGIVAAKAKNATHVLKTRTDQRLYSPQVLSYFQSLVEAFPVKSHSLLHSRLVIPDFGTLKYRPYGPSDMIMFGHVNDMLLYWGAEHDTRTLPKERKEKTVAEIAQLRLSEIYLCTSFLQKISHPLIWTLEDTWKVYADYFCMADSSSFELYWPKYDRYKEQKYMYYTGAHSLQQAQFSEWFMAYHGQLPEFKAGILNQPFGEPLQ